MAEYIKREDVIDICTKCVDFQDSIENINASAEAMRIRRLIKEMPPADVVPRKDYESMERTVDKLSKALAERKRGKWIGIPHKTTSKRNRTIHSMVYICPFCRYSNGRHKSNFCPNCGADMRESEEEDG